MIELIKSFGYRVFIRPGNDTTYCYYTDGTQIAYAQWGRSGTKICTVNLPCRECGTGFTYADEITEETISGALRCVAPEWASGRDRAAVRKYRNWEHFVNSDKFNSGLVEA